jgi:ABC-2 type transport system permease protein
MITIYKHEMKTYLKSLFIWFVCVGGMGFVCILIFQSIQTEMTDMAEGFASLGAFSDAFGMSTLSIATITGFYATEIGTIHSLGGAMFSTIVSTNMLSKEEDGHTGEFLFSLPISRGKVLTAKGCAVITLVVAFNILCVFCYIVGFAILGEAVPTKEFILYHVMQMFMDMEIAAICYAISAYSRKNKLGLGLGVALLLYAYDLIARISPKLSDYKMLSPFSYANASEIFGTGEIYMLAIILGVIVVIVSVGIAFGYYGKKDLN